MNSQQKVIRQTTLSSGCFSEAERFHYPWRSNTGLPLYVGALHPSGMRAWLLECGYTATGDKTRGCLHVGMA